MARTLRCTARRCRMRGMARSAATASMRQTASFAPAAPESARGRGVLTSSTRSSTRAAWPCRARTGTSTTRSSPTASRSARMERLTTASSTESVPLRRPATTGTTSRAIRSSLWIRSTASPPIRRPWTQAAGGMRPRRTISEARAWRRRTSSPSASRTGAASAPTSESTRWRDAPK